MSMFRLLHLRTPRTMPERFAWIMDALFWAMTEKHALVPDWFLHLATRRIRRFGDRVSRVLAALAAGTYRAPRPRTPRPETAPKRERRHFPAHLAQIMPADARLPTKFAWLHHLLHDNARRYAGPAAGGMLRDLLQADPQIAEFAKTCPALARHLRALCHMRGLKPPHLPEYIKLPPRPPKPQREKPEKPVTYKYWMRPGPIFGERLRRFAKKSSR